MGCGLQWTQNSGADQVPGPLSYILAFFPSPRCICAKGCYANQDSGWGGGAGCVGDGVTGAGPAGGESKPWGLLCALPVLPEQELRPGGSIWAGGRDSVGANALGVK